MLPPDQLPPHITVPISPMVKPGLPHGASTKQTTVSPTENVSAHTH